MRPLPPKKPRLIALYILVLLLALLGLGIARSCAARDTLPHSRRGFSEGDTLDVAVVYGPGSYSLSGDTLTGMNYRKLTYLRDSLGWKLRLWPVVSAQEALPALEEGRYDIVASLPADHDLKTRFLVTSEVYLDRLVLIQRQPVGDEKVVTSALELAGDTVHVEAGSPAERRLLNLMREIGDTIHIVSDETGGEEYLVMRTATGQYRYSVVNEQLAREMKKNRYHDLNIETPVAFTQFQVWVVRPNDTELLQRLNAALAQ